MCGGFGGNGISGGRCGGCQSRGGEVYVRRKTWVVYIRERGGEKIESWRSYIKDSGN